MELTNDELVDSFLEELTLRFHNAADQFEMMSVAFRKIRSTLADLHDEYERFHPDYPDWEDQGGG